MLGGLIYFFFQAEDGIRDVAVTGVQTCALPISAVDVGGSPSHGDAGAASAPDEASAAGEAGEGNELVDVGNGGASSAGADTAGGASAGGAEPTGAGAGGAGGAAGGPAANVVKVSYGVTRQRIDGFGVATSWGAVPPT